MKLTRNVWTVRAIFSIIVLCFILPYTVLRDVDTWYGSFLFWTLATVVVIGLNALVSADWED